MMQLQQVTQSNRFSSFGSDKRQQSQVSKSDNSNRFANFQDTLVGTTTTTGRPPTTFQQHTQQQQDLGLGQDVPRIRGSQKSSAAQFNNFSNFQQRQPAAATQEPRSRQSSATNSLSRGSSVNSVSGGGSSTSRGGGGSAVSDVKP